MTIEIRNRQGEIIISGEYDSIKSAAEANSQCLENADLKDADLSNAMLGRANLSNAYLSGADLTCTELDGAVLNNANLHEAFLEHADLREAELNNADLSDTYCGNAFIDGASLVHANLSRAVMPNCGLSESDMQYAVLEGVDLACANLQSANLDGANLSHANLAGADLSRANLSGAILTHANLSGADLTWATVIGINLGDAILAGTVMNNLIEFIPEPESVRNLLREAFGYQSTAGMTHEEYVEFRLDIVMLIPQNVLDFLPLILEELIDTHTGDHINTEGVEYTMMMLNVVGKGSEWHRNYGENSFSLFTTAHSGAVYQWLMLAMSWEDCSDCRSDLEPAIVYWRERAALPDQQA